MPGTTQRPLCAKHHLLLLVPWLLALVLTGTTSRAADFSEYELKAGFLLKFLELTEWPANRPTLTIGVLGDDPFGGALERTVQGQKVAGRSVAVRRSRRVEDLTGCQIVFVTKGERGRAGDVVAGLAGSGALTVGDFEDFARMGGVIAFVVSGDKIRFEVNPGAAKQTGVKVSSRLQKAGHVVGS